MLFFFRSVPLKNPNRKLWIDAIENFQPFDYVIQNYYVCSLHFSSTDLKISGKRKTVISGRFPTIFPPQNTTECSGSRHFGEITEEASNLQTINVDGVDNNIIHADTENISVLDYDDDDDHFIITEPGQTTNANDSCTE